MITSPIENSLNPLSRYLVKFSAGFPEDMLWRVLDRLMERAVPDIRMKRKAAPLPV
ncbi:hypothetical protein MmTuc01_1238 [Methanosarcina mazei Tuc01]|uniref:Uncharacterized protein n=1 Tax=Methanosarcina mazei Tuc01 TaxID=1236903 RepID=M1Q2X9_METMZ|nr:hypothetical protein MmTuc01_1238 [Methanosarcina mazei Tuc01]